MTDLKPPEDKDELLGAVLTLVSEVRDLNEKLALYAPRTEVRSTLRSSAWRFFALAVVVILISQVLTMTTISYCFLNANSNARAACTVMPGYGEAVRQNNVRLSRFDLLLGGLERTNNTAAQNDERLDKLEKRLEDLEKQGADK
jgi:hypothetical protein